MKIGFIGIGVMGKAMVRNIAKAGHKVTIYSRTKSKAEELIQEGIEWCDSISSCAFEKDIVITMLGYPKDVEEVYFGELGIIDNASEETYFIDMTTTSPKLSVRIYEEARKKDCFALDAPVSGGDIGAQNATLAIMVGGDKKVFDHCYDLLTCMGKNIVYEGLAGNGQHTKMANQIAIAGVNAGLCEAMVYAKQAGLDINTVLKTISTGAAGSWQMSNTAPRIMRKDFNPGFFIKHFLKDMNIALEEAEGNNLSLETLKLVRDMYAVLEQEGNGEEGTQALIKYYDREW